MKKMKKKNHDVQSLAEMNIFFSPLYQCINHPMLEYRGYLILTAPYHAVAVESKERSTLNSDCCEVRISLLFASFFSRACFMPIAWYRQWYEQYLGHSFLELIFPHLSTCSGGCILFSDPLRGRCLSLARGGLFEILFSLGPNGEAHPFLPRNPMEKL